MTFEDDLLALEQRVLADAAGDFLTAVDELRRMLVTGASGVRQRLARVAITDFENIVRNGILDAHELGGAQGLADAAKLPDLAADTLQGAKRALGAAATGALLAPVTGLSALAVAAVGTGLTLLATGSPPDVALSPVFGAANTVKGVVTSQVNQAANRAVATVAGYASAPLVWQSERDACVYCLDLAGKVVRPGEVFPEPNTYAPQPASYGFILEPPRHRNCLPGDAVVTPGSRVTGASKRMYEGEMVRIRTLSGKELSATPNHPVLTDRGWVALGLLRVGDRVLSRVGSERALHVDQDDEHVPAPICEVAEAALSSRKMVSTEVPMSAVDFHGDGTDGEVAHVAADVHLPTEDLIVCDQHARELLLVGAVELAASRSSGSDPLALTFGLNAPPQSGVGSFGETRTFLWGRFRHALEHAFGPVSWFDAAVQQATSDDSTADPEAVGDALLALAGEVVADQLVDVERYAFSGHVYNLETETGWYIGNGIIVHNCRCTLAVLYDPGYAEALEREAQRSILRGYSLRSESQALRIRAAARLLATDPVAPKSVKAYAAKAVREGKFPNGRDVPGGSPRLVVN